MGSEPQGQDDSGQIPFCRGRNCYATSSEHHSPECLIDTAISQGWQDSPVIHAAKRFLSARRDSAPGLASVTRVDPCLKCRHLSDCGGKGGGCASFATAPTEPADLPLPYQAEAIARGEMAERLRVAEARVAALKRDHVEKCRQLSAAQAELAATKTELSHVVQVSGVLCEKCGWAMKFPDEPCRCELEAELAAARGGVVIPDLVDGEVDMEVKRLAEPLYRSMALPDSEWARGVISGLRRGYELARFRLRSAVPEGTVLVDAGELEALRDCRAILVEHMETDGGMPMSDHLATSLERSQHPGQGGKGGDGGQSEVPPSD